MLGLWSLQGGCMAFVGVFLSFYLHFTSSVSALSFAYVGQMVDIIQILHPIILLFYYPSIIIALVRSSCSLCFLATLTPGTPPFTQ